MIGFGCDWAPWCGSALALRPEFERARERDWIVHQMEADHNAQWSKPAELVELLHAAPGEAPAAE